MPSGCNAVRVYAIKTSESRLLGHRGRKRRRNEGRGGKQRRKGEREGERLRETGRGTGRKRGRERESKGTDGPGRGKRYNPISCTINRPSGHPTAQLQHISAGRTKDDFAGPHQTCLSVTKLELRPPLLRSQISFDVLYRLPSPERRKIRTDHSSAALGHFTEKVELEINLSTQTKCLETIDI